MGEVRKKAVFWLALVFVLGAATGGVFGFNLAHRSYASTKPPVLNEAERRAKKVDEMTREIGLDAEQAKKEDAIIAEAQAEMRAIRDKNESEIDAVRMKAREATRVFLTPEQKAKFEEYAKRMDEEHRKQREAQGH
jgi:hypothetical protein